MSGRGWQESVYSEWATAIPTGDEAVFKRILEIVTDRQVQWPISVSGVINGLYPLTPEVHTVVTMLFYLVNVSRVLNVKLIHMPSRKEHGFDRRVITEAERNNTLDQYSLRFYRRRAV